MQRVQQGRAAKQVQVTGVLGVCLLTILLPRLMWTQAPASSVPIAAGRTPAPPPRSPADAVLREARRSRTRAKLIVNRDREALESWDPRALAGIDAEAWRLQQMAADRGGDLRRARVLARQAAAQSRTPQDAYAAAELLVLIEHESGHHETELQYARTLVALQPRQPQAWMVLRCAMRCNAVKGDLTCSP